MFKRRLAQVVGVLLLMAAAGLALAQDAPDPDDMPLDLPSLFPEKVEETRTPVLPEIEAPEPAPSYDKARFDELEVVSRVALTLPKGTRWQIERTLQPHRFYLILSPSPPNIKKLLAPYRGLGELTLEVDRAGPRVSVVRFEQRRVDRGALLARAVMEAPDQKPPMDRMLSLGEEGTGVIEETTTLAVYAGRLKRHDPAESFCRFVRMPMEAPVAEGAEGLETWRAAEREFMARRDDKALALYNEIALPIKAVVDGLKIKAARVVSIEQLAALRIGDVQVCRGSVRSARLRYELLKGLKIATPVKLLAAFKWMQLTHPAVDPKLMLSAMGEMTTDGIDPLGARVMLHAVRVRLLAGADREAVGMLASIPSESLEWADPVEMMALREKALAKAMSLALMMDEDVVLVSLARGNSAQVWGHPLGRMMAVETGAALRRLGLPDQSVIWLQEAMEHIESASDDALLLAELARAYRESGDLYRSERTIRYLIERLTRAKGWLGRREELTISRAATEVALDGRDWPAALTWLDRALEVGAGGATAALRDYVRGQEALGSGDLDVAGESLMAAARRRAAITPFRRGEVCLAAARVAGERGEHAAAVSLLRRFMAETDGERMEVEVAFALAHHMEKAGQVIKAEALFRDVALRQPEGTYGKLAEVRAQELGLRTRHARLLGETVGDRNKED